MRIKRSSMKLNNDIPDKIMERIRKLMRLKESTTSEGEARETALTCCHDALIDKYLEKIGAGTSKAHPRKTGTDRSAYYSGMGDGRNISLNRQIKGGWYMTVLWISFAALYALGMLWLAYQIRTAPSDLDLWGEEIE